VPGFFAAAPVCPGFAVPLVCAPAVLLGAAVAGFAALGVACVGFCCAELAPQKIAATAVARMTVWRFFITFILPSVFRFHKYSRWAAPCVAALSVVRFSFFFSPETLLSRLRREQCVWQISGGNRKRVKKGRG